MKALKILTIAVLTFTASSLFANQEDSPLYCTSDDLSLVVYGDPGQKSVTLLYGGRPSHFAPDEELDVNVVSRVFNRLLPKKRMFSVIAAPINMSKSNYYIILRSEGPIDLKVTAVGIRATFKAMVSGSIPEDEEGRSFLNVPIDCVLKPVLFKK